MPEHSKKNDRKNAKEQRKPRQRHHQAKADKEFEKQNESKGPPTVTVPQGPPVYESPPPEFYKNLKRETDEILKITEEENTRYKKKEIQSNWAKYEVPIETYDDIEEQENLGADYEKLIEAPLSAGGHFQFKHEKSWSTYTGPSQYDKYFEINMEDLNIALNTITFLERNGIERTLFSESDILSMNNRTTRFKQKYFGDKLYSTPEIEVQDKILNSLRDDGKNNDSITTENEINNDHDNEDLPLTEGKADDIKLQLKDDSVTVNKNFNVLEQNVGVQKATKETVPITHTESIADEFSFNDFIFRKPEKLAEPLVKQFDSPLDSNKKVVVQTKTKVIPTLSTTSNTNGQKEMGASESKVVAPAEIKIAQASAVAESPVDTKKNTVFESPEDLEKWLDDYLDG